MTWSYPSAFYGFLLVPLVLLAAWLAGRSSRKYLGAIGGIGVEWQVRSFLRNLSMIAFVSLIVLAVAEPRGGRKPIPGERSGLDVAVAFDVSRSMYSQDIEPDRLTRATSALRQISGSLVDSRFSLIPFKGDARVSVPMTEDRVIFDLWIDRLGPGLSSVPGTDLESALRLARDSFPGGGGRKRAIVLISDGESLSGRVSRVVRDLQDEGIPVHVLVAGTVEGGTVPLGNGDLVTDEYGQPVVSKADLRSLKKLVDDTGGSLHSLEKPGAVAELITDLDAARVFAETRGIRFVGVHRYRVFLIPSLIMVFVYLFARIIPWRRR